MSIRDILEMHTKREYCNSAEAKRGQGLGLGKGDGNHFRKSSYKSLRFSEWGGDFLPMSATDLCSMQYR